MLRFAEQCQTNGAFVMRLTQIALLPPSDHGEIQARISGTPKPATKNTETGACTKTKPRIAQTILITSLSIDSI
jgi:hypothetical protein